ncbi:hypothetical protein [Qingshengfaniella alkalisoli]|uniref:Tetratricopeptide repeat-like domain-containing protein n=1 Tax=Qingshengfaniella alkalisoli TaxID=2599296 RepID=A0A5B8I6A1_9RHOB|nr:hypothetical protein [Qingshengfaniella alkalisoli]QDY68985.1 hypothetical protein FPZ52_04645 [Qingshengfaniella alkalisoli]
MSNPDSFIDEVTEEVRRDRLYGYARKYGWIAVAVVVAIVGGAGYLEWQKAQDASVAQASGDALISALDLEDPGARAAALDQVDLSGPGAAIRNLLEAAQLSADSPDEAIAALRAIADNTELPLVYRDLATVKMTMVPEASLSTDEKIAILEPLTAPGRPFRLSAMESEALVLIEQKNTDAALEKLAVIVGDNEASDTQRSRAQDLIVALGGSLDAS